MGERVGPAAFGAAGFLGSGLVAVGGGVEGGRGFGEGLAVGLGGFAAVVPAFPGFLLGGGLLTGLLDALFEAALEAGFVALLFEDFGNHFIDLREGVVEEPETDEAEAGDYEADDQGPGELAAPAVEVGIPGGRALGFGLVQSIASRFRR